MEYRQLTRDGTQVSVIGLGTWPFGGGMGAMDDQTAIAITRAAIDNGINLIDTAQVYGESEERLGKALKDGYRDRCFLATKVWREQDNDYSPAAIYAAMDDSLRKLDVDYVDLYQIHHPDPSYPLDQTMEALDRLREQGKTRYIGVSNFWVEHMEEALTTTRLHTNQPRYNMLDRRIEAEVLPFCERNGIGIMAHSPLAKGLLTGRYRVGHKFPEDDERSRLSRFRGEPFAHYVKVADQLKQIAAHKNLSLIQLAIGWLLRLSSVSCVLVGAKRPDQIHEHLGAAGVTFSDDELARIESILQDTPATLYDDYGRNYLSDSRGFMIAGKGRDDGRIQ
jgi:aryl-alcohol dehydrogenase-like predicted oxidoreductase